MSLNPTVTRSRDRKRKKALYSQWKADGKCYYCGADPIEGKHICPKCKEKRKGASHSAQRKKKAARNLHICVSCLKAEAMPGRRLCGYCREYHDEATRKYRLKGIANGKCHSCGAHDPEPGYVRCARCIAKGAEIKARYRERHKKAAKAA